MTQPTDEAMLFNLRGAAARAGLRDLARNGLAEIQPGTTRWCLTAEGVQAAMAAATNGNGHTREMPVLVVKEGEA
jgi:hypothetical protein